VCVRVCRVECRMSVIWYWTKGRDTQCGIHSELGKLFATHHANICKFLDIIKPIQKETVSTVHRTMRKNIHTLALDLRRKREYIVKIKKELIK